MAKPAFSIGQGYGLDTYAFVGIESVDVESSECGRVLVLLSDGFAEVAELYATGLLGQPRFSGFVGTTKTGHEVVQGSDGKRRR